MVKFIIAQYWILCAKSAAIFSAKKYNSAKMRRYADFKNTSSLLPRAASLQPYCSCTMYGTKYIPKRIPDEAATIKRERCRRQYMPILRMRIRTGKTRRQNVFSPMRMLFRISADYAPLWNTCATALCRIKIFRNKSVRKKHLILTFNHFALSIEPASGRQQEDGDGFLFPNPRDGKYRKHLITHFFNKKYPAYRKLPRLYGAGNAAYRFADLCSPTDSRCGSFKDATRLPTKELQEDKKLFFRALRLASVCRRQ